MPIVVIAMEQADYEAWVKKTQESQKQKPDLSDQSREQLIAHGESVYLKNCVGCHQINGAGVPGLIPALTGSAIATGKWESLDVFLRSGTTKMPKFDKLNGKDSAELMTYVRNYFGNNVGDVLQPKETALPNDDDE
jgi:cytochrome c oxidase subunit 2